MLRKLEKSKYKNFFDFRIKYPEKKFVIYTRGRTGSTVLTDLLNCHPEIFCDVEIFNFLYCKSRILFPIKYIESCSKRATIFKKNVYGFKVKISQLLWEHKYKNYNSILKELHEKGWQFIHLKRVNHLGHHLSNLYAAETNIYHFTGEGKNNREHKIKIDCVRALEDIKYSEKVEKQEEEFLAKIPHLKVFYEKDILDNTKHQEVSNRIFSYLGLKQFDAKTIYKKVTPERLEDSIQNYEEVYNYFKNTDYADFLK